MLSMVYTCKKVRSQHIHSYAGEVALPQPAKHGYTAKAFDACMQHSKASNAFAVQQHPWRNLEMSIATSEMMLRCKAATCACVCDAGRLQASPVWPICHAKAEKHADPRTANLDSAISMQVPHIKHSCYICIIHICIGRLNVNSFL